MEILSLNVRGASFLKNIKTRTETEEQTTKLEEFGSVVLEKNFPILCLSETMLKTKPGDIGGYKLVAWRPGYERTEGGGGRPSGGLAVYRKVKVKDTDTVVQIEEIPLEKCEICSEIKEKAMSCESKCSLCKVIKSFRRNQPDAPRCLGRWLSSRTSRSDCTCANCIWHPEENSLESNEFKCHYDCKRVCRICRICRFLLPFNVKLTYKGKDHGKDINVCLVYFPPYDGPCKAGYDKDFIHMVHNRTISTTSKVPFTVVNNVLQTWLEPDTKKQTKNIIVIGDMNANTGTWNLNRERKSEDATPIDHFGQRLLSLCRERQLEILNGCTTYDSEGTLTSGTHVYDYALVHSSPTSSCDKFPEYGFRVLDIALRPGLFDHKPIVVKIGKYSDKEEGKDKPQGKDGETAEDEEKAKDNQARAAVDVEDLTTQVKSLKVSSKKKNDEE